MPTLECKGKLIEVDEKGFLINRDDWNEGVALVLASQEGFDSLSAEQMEIIRFMREYFLKYKVFPLLTNICRMADQPEKCVYEEFINPEKAWKIAGLPQQDGIQFVSFDGGKHYTMESDG